MSVAVSFVYFSLLATSNMLLDLWLLNSFTEFSAGLVAFLFPHVMFSSPLNNKATAYIGRWWGAAVICIGLISFLITPRMFLEPK